MQSYGEHNMSRGHRLRPFESLNQFLVQLEKASSGVIPGIHSHQLSSHSSISILWSFVIDGGFHLGQER